MSLVEKGRAPITDGDVFAHFSRQMTLSGCGKRFSTAMVWAYFDESENDATNTMFFGGCIAPQDRWDAFSEKWRDALSDENITEFHATDFHAYQGQFDWKLKSGKRDVRRHNAFDRRLASLVTQHADGGAFAFSVPIVPVKGQKPKNAAYRLAVSDAMREMLQTWFWGTFQPQYFILARRSHIDPLTVLKHFEKFSFMEKLSGCGVFPPSVFLPLQAADYVLHAVNRYDVGHKTLSHKSLAKGFGARKLPFLTKVAPSDWASSEWKN